MLRRTLSLPHFLFFQSFESGLRPVVAARRRQNSDGLQQDRENGKDLGVKQTQVAVVSCFCGVQGEDVEINDDKGPRSSGDGQPQTLRRASHIGYRMARPYASVNDLLPAQ
jgi:hypothetical protein